MARSPRIAGRVLGGLFLGWGAYAVICWSRYGRDRAATQHREDPLDAFISDPEIDERHQTRVGAPAAAAMKTLRELDVNQSPLVWLIFNLRTLPARLRGGPVQWEYKGLVDQMLAIGWGVLADIPDRNGDRTDNRRQNLELWSRSHPPGQRVGDLVAWLACDHPAEFAGARTQARARALINTSSVG